MIFKAFRNILLPVFLFSLLLLPTDCDQPRQQDPKGLIKDENGLTFDIIPPTFEMEPVQGPSDDRYQRIRMDGWARTSRVGYPELPLTGLLVQVPETGEVNVEIIENEVASVPGCRIVPVPERFRTEDGEIKTRYVRDEAAYRSSSLFPGNLADVGCRQVIRGVSVVRVTVYPFQWNPATGELLYSTKLRLRVNLENPFPPDDFGIQAGADTRGPGPGHRGAFDGILKDTVHNYQGMTRTIPYLRELEPDTPQFEEPRVRLEITGDGIYRVTYEDLSAAGLILSDPDMIQLFNQGCEVAVKVVSGVTFGPGDYIEFYGQGIDSPYTDTNVYWLFGDQAVGKRVSELDGEVTGTGTLLESFLETLHVEENHEMWDTTPGAPDLDYWFWVRMTATMGSPSTQFYNQDIPSPAPGPAGEAVIRVAFRGRSTASPHPNHHTRVYLNGTDIGDEYWDGTIEHEQEMTVSSSLLVDGANTLTVESPGDTGAVVDVVYHNWIEVEYWRFFTALADRLSFSVTGEERVKIEIEDLSQPDLLIYDVTDPCEAKEVVNFSVQTNGPEDYTASFEDELSGSKTFIASTTDEVMQPDFMERVEPEDLKSTGYGADYLLITAREFLSSVTPLIAHRTGQGLRALAVSVEDIYSDFSYGLVDPAAIKAFLQYTYENWTPPAPTYVLLLGDANVDYRDYTETGKKSRVPVHLSVTPVLGLTPDDNWYVCVEGEDNYPDMLVGRIPGDSAPVVAGLVSKILDYETSQETLPPDVLFVADDTETGFETLNEDLIKYLPARFNAHRVYLELYENTGDATQDIISNVDQGRVITNYVGHGAVTNWAGEFLFESADVPLLDNGDHLTFVITLDCLNGYFSQPSYYCLAEEFVLPSDKGAIGCFSPSGLGYLWEHNLLGHALFSRIFKKGKRALGILTTESKIMARDQGATEDLLTMFTLFGDPALELKVGPTPGSNPGARAAMLHLLLMSDE